MSISVTVSANWDRWVAGFQNLADDAADVAESEFEAAAEVLLSRSQTYAHVLSGDMMSTGRLKVGRSGDEVTATVEYGGIPGASGRMVNYAGIENARGGSHAFMDRAVESTERMFSDAMPSAWERVVKSWS